MNRQAQRALAEEYRHRIANATDDALKGVPAQDLKEQLLQIENYGKLVALNDNRRSTADARWAALVALVCLAIASFLWSYRARYNSISLTADTETLQGELKSDWQLVNPFLARSLHVARASRLEAPSLGISLDSSQGDAWLRVEGGVIGVQSLDLTAGGLLSLTSNQSSLNILVSRRPMSGKVTVVGTATITAGTTPQQITLHSTHKLDIPETIEFAVIDPAEVPSQITVDAPQNWTFGKVPYDNLDFASEELHDVTESNFTSGLKSGSLTFNDVGWPAQNISEKDILALHDTGQSSLEVRSNGSLIHVTLNGVVGNVTTGQGSARRELAPSYLEYLYNKKKLSFFWGSVAGIWGVLWGIRKTVFR